MRCHGAAAAFVMTAVLAPLACGVQGDGRQSVRDTAARSPATSVVDTGKSLSSTGDLPVTLPVSESTPIGIRIDSVTIWLDSTRIGAPVRSLGLNSALGRYAPGDDLMVACYHFANPVETYLILKAGFADTGRVVHAVIGRERDNTKPPLRCAALSHPPARLSNSLGLKLGMTWGQVEHLLGKSDDTTRGPVLQFSSYVLARLPKDTSDAGEERAMHANV